MCHKRTPQGTISTSPFIGKLKFHYLKGLSEPISHHNFVV